MGADKKKKSKTSKKSKKKTKKSNKYSKHGHAFWIAIYKHLKQICFAIAVFDLLNALYFAVVVTIHMIMEFNAYLALALLGTIFWVSMVILLIVGLWKRRSRYVKYWLVVSVLGLVMDVVFLIWGVTASIAVDWDHLREYTIVFIGIFLEILCIYVIYNYYLIMDPCRLIYAHSKEKKKVRVDAKECKARHVCGSYWCPCKKTSEKKSTKKSAKKKPKKVKNSKKKKKETC